MKPKSALRSLLLSGSSLLDAPSLRRIFFASTVLATIHSACAVEYWWNENDTAAGWGAAGVWNNTTTLFSTTNSDTASAAIATTGTSDILNFGTSTTGFDGGNITFTTTQSIGTIVAGSANTAATTFKAGVPATAVITLGAAAAITNNSAHRLAFEQIVNGAGSITINDSGAGVNFAAFSQTLPGIINLQTGKLVMNNPGVFGTASTDASRTEVSSGAEVIFNNSAAKNWDERFLIAGAGVGGTSGALTFNTTSTSNLRQPVTLSGDATIYTSNTGATTLSNNIVLGGNELTLRAAGASQTVTGGITGVGGSLVKSGGNTLTLSGTNTYDGGTAISAGTLVFLNTNAKPSGAAVHAFDAATTIGLGVAPSGTFFTGDDITSAFAGGTMTGNLSNVTVTSTTNVLVDVSAGNSISAGSIAGSPTKSLTKTGANTLTLSGDNTYTGDTIFNAGGLNLNSATAIGTGKLTINAIPAILDNTTANPITLTANNTQDWNADFTFTGTRSLNMGTGAVTMNANRTVTVSANTFTVGGAIGQSSGSRTLTKSGAGTMVIGGNNSYSGATTVSAGTLVLDYSAQDNSKLANAAALTLGSANLGATLSLVGGTHPELVTGCTLNSQAVVTRPSGTATLSLGGITRNAGSTLDVPGGAVVLTSSGAASSILVATAGAYATVDGGTDWAAKNVANTAIVSFSSVGTYLATDATTLGGDGNSDVSAGIDTTLTGDVTGKTLRFNQNEARTLTIDTSLALGTSTPAGGGILVTPNVSPGSGTTTITGGTLKPGANNNLQILQYSPKGMTIDSIIANGSAASALTKGGSGSLTLGGNNTYTGVTYVTSGKLFINGDQSSAAGNVTVASGASLGGTGTIGGSTTIASGGNLEFDLSTNDVGHNKLELVSGKTLTFSAGAALTITSSGGASPGAYTLVTVPGPGANPIAALPNPLPLNLPPGWEATVARANSNQDLVLTVTSTGGGPDLTAPTLVSIVDDQGGGPVTVGTPVTYTVTFSEDIDSATVSSADFSNAGSSTITIGTITETTPGVFTVLVTPTSAGSLTLQIPTTAVVNDLAGNPLDNDPALLDDTTITVNVADPYATWSGGAAFGIDTNGDGVDNGLAWVLGAADPAANAIGLLPTLDNTTDPNFFIFNYRRKDDANTDPNTTIKVEYGGNLVTWTPAVASADIVITPTNDFYAVPPNAVDKVEVKIRRTLATSGKLFVRLNVVKAP